MKQHGDAGWSGHREISYAATDRLFAELAGPDGLIRGYTRTAYAQALDRAQAHQDRPIGAGVIKNFANSGHTFPYAGPGPASPSTFTPPPPGKPNATAGWASNTASPPSPPTN